MPFQASTDGSCVRCTTKLGFNFIEMNNVLSTTHEGVARSTGITPLSSLALPAARVE